MTHHPDCDVFQTMPHNETVRTHDLDEPLENPDDYQCLSDCETPEEALRQAIAQYGSAEIQWVLTASPSRFYEAWDRQLGQLEEYGECELSGRYTLTGNPHTVTVTDKEN